MGYDRQTPHNRIFNATTGQCLTAAQVERIRVHAAFLALVRESMTSEGDF